MTEYLLKQSEKLRLLVCKDIDGPSASKIAEKFVPQSPCFDGVILFGPFIHEKCHGEKLAAAEADTASIIAQFENVVCRVIYLPGGDNDVCNCSDQLHLTPNSVCIHGRSLQLSDELFMIGFSEKGTDVLKCGLPADSDRSAESDEETENVRVESGSSISTIRELLKSSTCSEALGIFALNYKYSHTLNQFLFHSSCDLKDAGVGLCVIASDQDESVRLPTKLGDLWLASVRSLRSGGFYTVIEIERDNSNCKWVVSAVNMLSLKDDTV